MRTDFSLKEHGEKELSKNFKVKEFACKDGSDKIIIDTELIDVLQKFRDMVQCPVKIISGYRTDSYNKQCGGALNSYHLKGMAADVQVGNHENYTFLALCAALCGARGVGRYPGKRFLHIDVREKPYTWEVK